jgi:hypothetical protein
MGFYPFAEYDFMGCNVVPIRFLEQPDALSPGRNQRHRRIAKTR